MLSPAPHEFLMRQHVLRMILAMLTEHQLLLQLPIQRRRAEPVHMRYFLWKYAARTVTMKMQEFRVLP